MSFFKITKHRSLLKAAAFSLVASFAVFSFFVKASAPTILFIMPSSGSQAGGDTVTITGKNFKTAPSVLFGGNPATNVTLKGSTVITATVPAHIPGKVNVNVINADGQSATFIDGYTYNYPPTVTSISPNTGSTAGGDTITIRGANFFGIPKVLFGENPAAAVTADGTDSLSITTPAHEAGLVDVTIANPDGQSATLVAAFTFFNEESIIDTGVIPVDLSGTGTVSIPSVGNGNNQTAQTVMANPSPTITSVSPSSGNRFGGDSVTITGTNFIDTPSVTFDGVRAIGTIYQSSTTLVVTTPANSAGGVVNVVVTNPKSHSSATLVNGFTYLTAAPTISSITPSIGSITGGVPVTIMGTGFYGSPGLTFGGIGATSIVVRSATKITAIVPAHASGMVDVVLANQDSQSATFTNGFTYASFENQAPTITSISPDSGTTGTNITITGTNFLPNPTVKINGLNAGNVGRIDSETIAATAPSNGYGTYDVTVINTDGQMAILTGGFTYREVPTVATSDVIEISPDSVTLNATVISTGGENPARYIDWGKTSGLYTNTCDQGVGDGSYACDLINLAVNTTYYFRAKAINSSGTSYGQEKSFTTLPSSVTITDPDSAKLNSANGLGHIKSSGSLSKASSIKFNTAITFKRSKNKHELNMPRKIQVTRTGGGTFDMSQFMLNDISDQTKRDVSDSLGAVEIGVPDASLSFSVPATLSVAVSSGYEGKTLVVQSKSYGSVSWVNEGNCTVANDICSFPINHATDYMILGGGVGGGPTDMTTYVRLDRMSASTATGGMICATPNYDSVETSVVVSFPIDFTLNQTASNWTVNTSNLPSGAVAWVGINTATGVLSKDVTFPSGDLVVGQLYCFNFSPTNTLVTSTAGNSKVGTITTKDFVGAAISSSGYALAIVSNDQISLNATVLPTLSTVLDGNADAFTSALSSSSVVSSQGRNVTVATNADNGWVAWVKSANAALTSTSAGASIQSTGSLDNTPTDLSSATGYVLDVNTTDSQVGSGVVSQGTNYGAEYAGPNTTSGGTLSTAFQPVASCNGTTDGDVMTLIERAKITSVQAAASDYTDRLTIIVSGRF